MTSNKPQIKRQTTTIPVTIHATFRINGIIGPIFLILDHVFNSFSKRFGSNSVIFHCFASFQISHRFYGKKNHRKLRVRKLSYNKSAGNSVQRVFLFHLHKSYQNPTNYQVGAAFVNDINASILGETEGQNKKQRTNWGKNVQAK